LPSSVSSQARADGALSTGGAPGNAEEPRGTRRRRAANSVSAAALAVCR
jgi:hypothetical protein